MLEDLTNCTVVENEKCDYKHYNVGNKMKPVLTAAFVFLFKRPKAASSEVSFCHRQFEHNLITITQSIHDLLTDSRQQLRAVIYIA